MKKKLMQKSTVTYEDNTVLAKPDQENEEEEEQPKEQ